MTTTTKERTRLAVPVSRAAGAKCAHLHFGAWAIEPRWFAQAVSAIRAGTWQPAAFDDDGDGDGSGDDSIYSVQDGIATISIDGQMTKAGSSFGGCSTVDVRRAVRMAAADQTVTAVMLHICSPGGTVAGTADLADDINAARARKPVQAYVADLGCSAAYWVASQCETITANVTAIVGSIGTYAILEDDTGAQEQVGITYRTVSTGPYKGLGADGKVSDELVADVQREINELNAPFLAAVQAGRGKKISSIAGVADGRAYAATQAKQLGLIDEIASFDAAMNALSQRTMNMPNPSTYVPPATAAKPAGGIPPRLPIAPAATAPEPQDPKAKAKAEWAAMSAAERDRWISEDVFVIARVREQAAAGSGTGDQTEDQAAAAARLDWAANKGGVQSDWLDEKTYVDFRRAEARGQVRASRR